MLGRGPEAASDHGANGDRDRGLAAEHVAQLGALVEQGIEATPQEPAEHQFGDGTQPGSRGPHRGSDEGSLGNGGVQNPLPAELVHQSLGYPHDAPPGLVIFQVLHLGSSGDVFAHDDDLGIGAHLQPNGLVEGLGDGNGSGGGGYSHFKTSLVVR